MSVCLFELSQDIRKGKFRVVIISPEQTMKEKGGFERLLEDPAFCARLICIVFDEAHCITRWGAFRPEYIDIAQLRQQLPGTPFAFVSATLTTAAIEDIKTLFALPYGKVLEVRRPNDRPNICIGVRQMKHSVESFLDLAFLVPAGWKAGDDPPPKFVAFFNDRMETVNAAKMLRKRLPPEFRHKIVWFNSNNSESFKREKVEQLLRGEIWGLYATDSFGLVSLCLSVDTGY